MKRYIRASFMDEYVDNYAIPEPFNQWYRIASDEEFHQMTRWPLHDYPCEQVEGYDAKHLAYVVGKDEYLDELENNGVGFLELVTEGNGHPFLGYVVSDELCVLDTADIPKSLREEQ